MSLNEVGKVKWWNILQASEDTAVTALGLAGGSAVFVILAEPVNLREGVTPQKIRQGSCEDVWQGFRCLLQRGVSIHYVFTERGEGD